MPSRADASSSTTNTRGCSVLMSCYISATLRQRKLKLRSSGNIARCPQPSAMGFDDRAADRESHTDTIGLGGVEGVEDVFRVLGTLSRAGITDGKEDAFGNIFLR